MLAKQRKEFCISSLLYTIKKEAVIYFIKLRKKILHLSTNTFCLQTPTKGLHAIWLW